MVRYMCEHSLDYYCSLSWLSLKNAMRNSKVNIWLLIFVHVVLCHVYSCALNVSYYLDDFFF